MKMKGLVYIVLACCSLSAFGQGEVLFQKATEAYNNGEYEKAIDYYEKALSTFVQLDSLRSLMHFNEQQVVMSQLEAEYEKEIEEKELERFRELDSKNKELRNQRTNPSND